MSEPWIDRSAADAGLNDAGARGDADRAPDSDEETGTRFGFGENWQTFLRQIDEVRIRTAEQSIQELLGEEELDGRTLLDIGCGSGLFSLAARRLGARVTSFDFDANSVACALELRRRFFPDDADWTVLQGSVLDQPLLQRLGRFDIVYTWGVLHHTGAMWQAIRNAQDSVAPGGRMVIAIYNDCGLESRIWRGIKRLYCRTPRLLQPGFAALAYAPYEARDAVGLARRGRFREYVHSWTRYRERRGMSKWVDIKDWVGGYPYEYASAGAIIEFFERHGFTALEVRPTATLGCNEFVFRAPRTAGSDRVSAGPR